jgi:hypothetical protein
MQDTTTAAERVATDETKRLIAAIGIAASMITIACHSTRAACKSRLGID